MHIVKRVVSCVPAVSIRKGFDTSAHLTAFAPRLFFKVALSSIIYAILLTMAACGGGGGNDTNGENPADTTSPEITSSSPASGATDVPPNITSMSATFSEAMSADTISNTTFTLSGGASVAGTVGYYSGAAVFTPASNLAVSTIYTATVTTGVTDVAGNQLAADYTWTFTTAVGQDNTPPEIASTSPVDGAVDVAVDAAISFVFSEPMNESTITATGGFTLQNGGPVYGSIAYDPETRTATFWPTGGFEDMISYTATIGVGVTDVAGNALASSYSWSFTTAENPIIRIPADGSDGRSLNPSISEDGRYVAFEVDAPGYGGDNVFVHDAQTGVTTFANVATGGTAGSGWGYEALVNSGGGRYIAFRSWATTLVTGDTNGFDDVFLRDTQTGTTTRVSVANDGSQSDDASRYPSISSDGRYVAFHSSATNLVAGGTSGSEIFMRDTLNNTTILVSINDSGVGGDNSSSNPSISGNGQSVAFESDAANFVSGDTNGFRDIFVRDTQAGATTRVSVHTNGTQSDGWSYAASISADGRYVVFHSSATNLVDGDTNGTEDVFLHDTQTGTTVRVSVNGSGVEGNGLSRYPSISSDGRYVAFESLATNLATGGSSGSQIFVRDTTNNTTRIVSVNVSGVEGDGGSESPSISADGRYVVFQSDAANLVAGDTNGLTDVFRTLNSP